MQREGLLERERAAREKAQHENTSKDQFLALLGHELRNPLAAITGATELLVRRGVVKGEGMGEGDATQRRMLEIVQRQNRHMKQIVEDLLEVSRMLSGKIVLAREALDLADCVRSCVEALRTTERAEGYRLTLQSDAVWVDGDAVRLEQIVNNLVTNALKFSMPGSEVRVSVRAAGESAVVDVADTGVGIGAELMPRIFEPFVQGPAAAGRQASGLGIGLALVRQLVALHGGAIEARSDGAGRGSTFSITLPRIEAQAVSSAAPRDAVRSNCRVLLVEDNADARDATAELLRSLGYEVSEAADADSAIAAAQRFAPEVLITDLGMPGKSGYDLAAAMQASALVASIPLIALSGYGQPRDVEATRAAGFSAHLVKPVAPDALVAAIERCRVARTEN